MAMSFRAYAKHRGVSVEAVSKAVRRGRISTIDEGGQRRIDPKVADLEWVQNSDPSKVRDPAPATTPAATPEISYAEPEGESEQERAEAANVKKQLATLHRSKAVQAALTAQLLKLDYDERAGKLVSAADVQQRWTQIASVVKAKILGVPSKLKQRTPDLTAEQFAACELIVREALEELSDE